MLSIHLNFIFQSLFFNSFCTHIQHFNNMQPLTISHTFCIFLTQLSSCRTLYLKFPFLQSPLVLERPPSLSSPTQLAGCSIDYLMTRGVFKILVKMLQTTSLFFQNEYTLFLVSFIPSSRNGASLLILPPPFFLAMPMACESSQGPNSWLQFAPQLWQFLIPNLLCCKETSYLNYLLTELRKMVQI